MNKKENTFRINREITAQTVRVIYHDDVTDEDKNEVMSTVNAIKIAEGQGVDLVEISANAQPHVCKVIDYNKYLYQLKKKAKENAAKQTVSEVKELRFGPQTDEHDYEFKKKHAIEFLQRGNKVKATVLFRGREIVFKEQGELILLRLANDLEEYGKIEKMPEMLGKKMMITINPKK